MAQKKVNWPLAYLLAGLTDILQFGGDLIPYVDVVAIPANEFIDVAVAGYIARWSHKKGLLDVTSGLAIGVTFLIEEMTAGGAPFWIGDIAILHMKYKANQSIEAFAQSKTQSGNNAGSNQNNRREPTGPKPRYQGGRQEPQVLK